MPLFHPLSSGRIRPLAVLIGSFILLGASLDAAALGKRDQAAVDALTQRMQAAETRYREGLVQLGNADPDGQAEVNAALEDMEDVLTACTRQKGCGLATMLVSYKRLLKLNADAIADDGEGEQAATEYDPDAGTPTGDVPEAARAAHLLTQGHRFDQMVQYNPAVQAGIRRWLTDMRGPLMNSYENYRYMRHLMWPAYEKAGLPEALLFGIMAKESNGKVHSTSRAGASGPMQFMYSTGRRFGLGDDGTGFDTRYDPHAAAEASAAYLNERMRQLNNSIELGLAAYNGGEGRALRVFNGSGGRNFWDESVYNQFPTETRDYVPMVIAAAWLFLHPREYGITFPKVNNKPAPLKLAQPSSIYQLTICLGNGGTRDGFMRALRNLNPRYQAEATLAAGTTLNATSRIVGLYNRWCVQGRRAELARTLVMSDVSQAIVRTGPITPVLAAASVGGSPVASDGESPVSGEGEAITPGATPVAAPAASREYTVQTGETLTNVAQKFECDTKVLAQANGIAAPSYNISPGQKLKLEGCRP